MKAAEERKHKRDEHFDRGPGEDYGDLLESVTVSRRRSARRRFEKTQRGQGCICTRFRGRGGKKKKAGRLFVYKLQFPPHGRNNCVKRCGRIEEKKNKSKKVASAVSESALRNM